MGNPKHPLEGIRVLDLGRQQAGPRCAQVLARMGAEVIKVERLGGEETRYNGPHVRGQSAYWVQHNSGKKSLSVDLRKEPAKEIVRELVKISDVFLQNFRPGTIKEMGFGYEVLKKLNPRIIMVNVSAYGQFGPYREKIGIDHIGQALGGATMVTGEEGMPPMLTGVAIMDRTTALTAAIGTLSALYEREASGEGQSIDVCLADTGYSYTEIPISAYLGGAKPPKRGESARPGSGIFPCKEGWILLSVTLQNGWPRFCDALGKPEWLEDPRFSTGRERGRNKDLINAALKELLSTMTMAEAVEHFTRYDVVAAPCNDIPQAAAESHPWERRALVEVPDFQAGTIVVSGDYWHFSRTPAVIGSASKVGEHNEEILTSLLGYSADQIEQLREAQVIGEWDHYSDAREEVSVL